ncbi:MAG: PorT family protein [Bacteroidetes bacterium]|nr:PorT family protein [Bacteroidota bacterium]MBL0064334.1 PorT family protein [Bacteroidota bacterium]MBL0139285.1 PorT family protein [Bacteroidota bacterium]
MNSSKSKVFASNKPIQVWMILPLLFFWMNTQAQMDRNPINLPKYDHQAIHFGFTLGLNATNFKVQLVPNFKTTDSIYVVESSAVTGLNLGIVSNLRIGEHWDLRFIPALSFAQRNLYYDWIYPDSSNAQSVKTVESTYLEFPLDLKFKSKRVTNYRMYVLAGARYSIDMVSQAKVRDKDKDIVKLKRYDYGYEIGLGFDFYLTYFKFSPEIKMFNGLNNLLVKDNSRYASPLEKLNSKIFLVSFLFE